MAEGPATGSTLKSSLSADDIDKSPKKSPGKLSADILGKFESDPALSTSPDHIPRAHSASYQSSHGTESLGTSQENVKSHNVRIKLPEKDTSSTEDMLTDDEHDDRHDRKRRSRWKIPGWKKFRKFFSRKKQPGRAKSCEELPTEHYKQMGGSAAAASEEPNLRLRAKSDPFLVPGGKKRPATIAVADVYSSESPGDKTSVSHTASMPSPRLERPGSLLTELKKRQSSSHEEVREEVAEEEEVFSAAPAKAVSLPTLNVLPNVPLMPSSGGSEEAVSFDSKVSTSSLEGLQAAHDKIKAAPKRRRPPSRNRSRTSSLNTPVSPIKEDPTHKRSKTDPQDLTKISANTSNAPDHSFHSDVMNKIVEGSEEETSAESTPAMERANKKHDTQTEGDVKADIMARANKILSETTEPAKLSSTQAKASTLPAVSRKTEKSDSRSSLRDVKAVEESVGTSKVEIASEREKKMAGKEESSMKKKDVATRQEVAQENLKKNEETPDNKIKEMENEKASSRRSWPPVDKDEKIVLRKVEPVAKPEKIDHGNQEALMKAALFEMDRMLDFEFDQETIENKDKVVGKGNEKPKEPEKTSKPKEPEKTIKTKEAEKTNKPKEPEKTNKPKELEKTSKPKEPEKTNKPKELEKTNKPKEPEKTSKPKEPEKTSKPEEAEKTSKPEETEKTSKPEEAEKTSPENRVSPRKASWPPSAADAEKEVVPPKAKPPIKRGKSWSMSQTSNLEETLIIIDQPKNELNKKSLPRTDPKPTDNKKDEPQHSKPEIQKKPDSRFVRTKSWSVQSKNKEDKENVDNTKEKETVKPKPSSPGVEDDAVDVKDDDDDTDDQPSWIAMANRASKRYSQLLQNTKPVEQEVTIVSIVDDKNVESSKPEPEKPKPVVPSNTMTPQKPKPTTPQKPQSITAQTPLPATSQKSPSTSPQKPPLTTLRKTKSTPPQKPSSTTPQKPASTTPQKTLSSTTPQKPLSSTSPQKPSPTIETKTRSASLKTTSPKKTEWTRNRNTVHEVAKNPFGGVKIEKCAVCGTTVYQMEKCKFDDSVMHRKCIKCTVCHRHLTVGNFVMAESKIYCNSHSQGVMVS